MQHIGQSLYQWNLEQDELHDCKIRKKKQVLQNIEHQIVSATPSIQKFLVYITIPRK